jgi:hypothetical protein
VVQGDSICDAFRGSDLVCGLCANETLCPLVDQVIDALAGATVPVDA